MQGVDRRAQFEHQRGVDDVLAGRAPMHVAARPSASVLATSAVSALISGMAILPAATAASPSAVEVVAFGAGGLGDRLDGERRDDADRRFRARERDLEIEHALQRARDRRGSRAWPRSKSAGSAVTMELAGLVMAMRRRTALAARAAAANPQRRSRAGPTRPPNRLAVQGLDERPFPIAQPTPYNSRHSSFVMPGPQSRLRRRLGLVCGAKLGHDAIDTKMENDRWR